MQAEAAYERARQSRDVRFDGQFFVAVKTTGIYCRPICPANSPKRENVDFFPTAAAASEAGFRPCLRCRPECAPGTPAWHGTSTTVRRGLKLIASGALDDGDVQTLANRLGVTSRHLRRLFSKHLGASPLSVAHTQRLHFAKRLIDQTDLPLSEIAIAAGYGSVRRFNDAFRKTYRRPPRDLRRRGRSEQPVPDSSALTVALSYRQPYDWGRMLGFLRGRAIPGVEVVTDSDYSRTVRVGDATGLIHVRHEPKARHLVLTVRGIDTHRLFGVVQQVREMFDVDAPIQSIRSVLARDPVLQRCLKGFPGVRVPGTWNGFELTIRAILGQQISVKAATTLAGRVARRYGKSVGIENPELAATGLTHLFPEPAVLARARLNGMGVVGARAATIRRVARAVLDDTLSFDAAIDAAPFRESLTSIRGIGDWTAQYVAMRALKAPDAFPSSDLGLLRAFDDEAGARIKPAALEARSREWRPWRAYAALLLWNSVPSAGG